MLSTKILPNGKEIIIGNDISKIEQMVAAEKYIQESKLKQHNETFGIEMNEKNLAWEEKVERLMKTYINEDINMMIRHLKKIHAELVKGYEKYGDAAVEVRALGRKSKTEKAIAYRSYVFYNFTDKSIDGFKDWYNKVVKGKAVCLYYSVANFEPKIRAYDSDGNRIKKNSNMINGDNVYAYYAIMLDFDGITVEENNQYNATLKALGLKYDDIRTNENGWQKIFYLKEACYDKHAGMHFTDLFLSRGFKVDEGVRSSSQVGRLLGSVNNKAFNGNFKRDRQFKVTREITTQSRITYQELWDKIASLPVKKAVDVKEITSIKPLTKAEINDIAIEEFEVVYGDVLSAHWIKVLPVAIKKMFLDKENEGYTNDFMMFIVAHIKNMMKFTRDDFITLMTRWSEYTSYGSIDKFVDNWDRYNHIGKNGIPFKSGKYTEKLQKRYGYLDFITVKDEYKSTAKAVEEFTLEEYKGNIVLNNKFTREDAFKSMSDGALVVYLCSEVQMLLTQKDYFTADEIIGHRLLKIKERQTKEYLAELVKLNYLTIEIGFRGNTKPIYKANKYFTCLTGTRNVVIDVQVAQRMLEQLKSNEMKMYLLFKSLIVNKEIDKFNIQAIATMLGVSVRTVKTVRKSLADKGFIIIQKQGTTICDKYLVF